MIRPLITQTRRLVGPYTCNVVLPTSSVAGLSVYGVGILGSALSSSSSSSSSTTPPLLLPKMKQNTFATMQSQPSMTTGTNSNSTNSNTTLTTKEESDKVSSTTNSSINSSILQHAYVHKISQTVLQHLQNTHHGWIVSQGLDRGLRLNPNGTFVLQFPNTSRGYDSGRIWTSYDAGTKQHWISVYNQKARLRFLLKQAAYVDPNNHYPKFTTFRAAVAESEKSDNHIRDVVNHLIHTVNDMKTKLSKTEKEKVVNKTN